QRSHTQRFHRPALARFPCAQSVIAAECRCHCERSEESLLNAPVTERFFVFRSSPTVAIGQRPTRKMCPEPSAAWDADFRPSELAQAPDKITRTFSRARQGPRRAK